MSQQFPIIWLTGNSGAGKTTLAESIRQYFREHPTAPLLLDGDEMRETISRDEGFSPEDRRKHNLRIARLAKLFQSHGFLVIVAVIAPFECVRREIDVLCDPRWIYVKRSGLESQDCPYEEPESPDLVINNDILSIEDARIQLLAYLLPCAHAHRESVCVVSHSGTP